MKKIVKAMITCIVLVLTMVLFVGCVPNNAESATRKMKEEGYSVSSYSVNSDGVTEAIIAVEKELFDDTLIAVWFDSIENAKAYMEKYTEEEDELIKRKGKCVYIGTADAIEDFED